MKSLLLRWTFIVTCALALFTSGTATAQAGLIPWLYDAIFGPNVPYGYGYQAGYAPMVGYRGYAASVTSYMPAAPSYASYSMACAPCDPCGGGACVGGSCGTNYAPARIEPIPAINEPPLADQPVPTYDTPSSGSGATDSTPPDEGFRQRSTDPADTNSTDDTNFGGETESFRQPMEGSLGPETTIRQREAAPVTPMNEDQDGQNGNGKAATDAGPVLDNLVTWRVAPSTKRLPLRASFVNPVVARRPVPVNQGWEPASAGTKLVSK